MPKARSSLFAQAITQASVRTSFAYAMALRLLEAGGLDFATELDGIAGNVRTDLSSSQVIDLANAFRPLGEATVYAAYVPGSESEQDGTALFKASDSQWKTVMESVDAGADPNAVEEAETVSDPTGIKVEIRNGGGITGVGAKMGEILGNAGFTIGTIGNVTDAGIYNETVQILAKPGINTVSDLKGKTICVGDVGSGTEINAWQVLGAAGLTKDDVNAVNGSFQDGVDQLKDGKIDAAFTVAGAPTTAIVDYATTNTLNLVSLSDDELAAIQEAYPFLIRDDLAAGTYTGQDADVTCVAIQATLVASEELSEDVVYEFVKAMFDNKDALTEGHAKFGFLDPEAASAGATVTMHPGAEKYYKEVGVL